jgi:hypothetical protein
MVRGGSNQAALRALRARESALQSRLEKVRDTLAQLLGITGRRGPGRPPGRASLRAKTGRSAAPRRRKRTLSVEGRAAISRAAKRRWSEYRRQRGRAKKRG